MFEMALKELKQAASTVAGCDAALMDPDERAAAIRTLRATCDILTGAESELLKTFEDQADYREHGAATTAAWVRRELRMTGTEARTRVAAARTQAQLPVIGQAARTGRIRFEHVTTFTAGIKKCDLETIQAAQEWLLPVAEHCDPAELRDVLNTLAEVTHPDELGEAWAKGMDKQDVKLAKTSQGYHLTGFLDIVSGARFKAWLESAAAPRDAEDERTPSERRTEAPGDLFDAALAHGMPTDRGVRPQLNINCDLETLQAMLADQDRAGSGGAGSGGADAGAEAYAAQPAVLTGFGPIGPDLLSYLCCLSDVTAIVTDGDTTGPTPHSRVLDVGRTRRLATMRQRRAVLYRQDSTCANPGCAHTHLEVHHVRWWRHGGPTDLDNLVGLCKRCHLMIHDHKLVVTADGHGGFVFRRSTGTIPDHRRTTARAVRRRLRDLLHPRRADRSPTSAARPHGASTAPPTPRPSQTTTRPTPPPSPGSPPSGPRPSGRASRAEASSRTRSTTTSPATGEPTAHDPGPRCGPEPTRAPAPRRATRRASPAATAPSQAASIPVPAGPADMCACGHPAHQVGRSLPELSNRVRAAEDDRHSPAITRRPARRR